MVNPFELSLLSLPPFALLHRCCWSCILSPHRVSYFKFTRRWRNEGRMNDGSCLPGLIFYALSVLNCIYFQMGNMLKYPAGRTSSDVETVA